MIDLRQSEQDDWMSLRQASEKMGVSGATLRSWADEGRVESYRTPGGHRRFRVNEKSIPFRAQAGQGDTRWRLLEHAALGQVQLAREQGDVLNPTLPPQARTEQRELERRLIHLVTYALPELQPDMEARAAELGQAYGKWNWRFGVGAREQFLVLGNLRRAFMAGLVEFAFGVGEPNLDELSGWLDRANEIIDRVCVSMLEYVSRNLPRMAENRNPKPSRGVRRIPQQSVLYERVVPLALIGMTVLLVVILLIAAGIVLGVIRF